MEESVIELLESIHPNESKKFLGIENLLLTSKYLAPLNKDRKNSLLFYRFLRMKNTAGHASLCLVHGFAEHSGRLINIGVYFALKGFEVHMIDLRSFGLSTGARCDNNLADFQYDINLLIQQAREDIPCFLWGHSMGGLLVTNLCMNNPSLNVNGVIISAPLYETQSTKLPWVKRQLSAALSQHLNELVLNAYIAPGTLSKDEFYLKNLSSDKLIIPLSGPKLGLSIVDHINYTNNNAALFKHPAIFYHGDADALTEISATQALYNKATSLDKTFRKLKGVYHEPHHDIERDEFLLDAYAWISQHMKNNPLGPVRTLKIGLAGLSKNKKISKYVFLGLIILYFLIGFKIKIQINPQKLIKLLNFITKIFWPLGLLLN